MLKDDAPVIDARCPCHAAFIRTTQRWSPVRALMIVPLALKALRRHVMRTILTTLGVIIGVSAVICTVAIGEGASAQIRTAIANIGANLVWVEAGGVNRNGVRTGSGATRTLTVADLVAIRDQVPTVTNITPQADSRV